MNLFSFFFTLVGVNDETNCFPVICAVLFLVLYPVFIRVFFRVNFCSTLFLTVSFMGFYIAAAGRQVFPESIQYLYKNRRCGMIIHETAMHQTTVESKLLQFQLRPSTLWEDQTGKYLMSPSIKMPETYGITAMVPSCNAYIHFKTIQMNTLNIRPNNPKYQYQNSDF